MSEIAELLVSAGWEGQDAEAGLERLGTRFDKTVNRMRDAQGRFAGARDAQRQAAQASREWATDLDGLNGKLGGNIQQMLAMAGVAATVAGAVTYIISAGTRTENSLNTLQSVTRATGEEMKRVSALARQLGNDVSLPGTSAADAADAMVELAKGGLTLQQSMDAARGTIQLARAATIEEAKAATITADALNTFGLAGTYAGKVADLLAGSANSSSGEITDMAQALAQAGAVAKSANVSIEDTVTALSLLAKNGVKGSDAGTSLKTFLLSLQAPNSKEAVETLRQLNIEAYDAANKTFKPLPNLIGEFQGALAKLNDEAKSKALVDIFGSDAIRAARILFGEGTEGFNRMAAAVTRSGQAAEIAAAKSKGLTGAWDALKSTVETFAIDVYGLVSGPLAALLQVMAAYPGLFVAAAVAVGSLILAHKLYNSELLITAATRLPALLASIRNTITIMTSFSQVTAMSSTALATFALGWVGVIAAVGIAAYALIDWTTAAERASSITSEMVGKLGEQAAQFANLQAVTGELASKQTLNAEEHKKLDAIIASLNPTTRAYISTLQDEKEKIDEVKKAVDDLANRSHSELEAKMQTVASAILETNAGIDKQNAVIKNAENAVGRWKRELAEHKVGQEEANHFIKIFSEQIAAANDEIRDKLTPTLEANRDRQAQLAGALHLSRDAFIKQMQEAGRTEEELRQLIIQYDAAHAKNQGLAGALDSTTGAVNAQAAALANLDAIMRRFNDRDQGITARVMSIVDQAKSKGEAVRMAREAMQNDKGFAFDVRGSVADKEEKEAVEQAIGLTKPAGGGGGGGGRRSGGGGSGESAIQKRLKLELDALKIVEDAASRTYARRRDDERHYYDVGAKAADSYFSMLKTLEKEHLEALLKAAQKELQIAEAGKPGKARENAVAKANDQITALYERYQQNITAIDREAYKAREEMQRERWANETARLQELAAGQADIYQTLADRGVMTFARAHALIADAQMELLIREQRRLENELKRLDPESAKAKDLRGQLDTQNQRVENFKAKRPHDALDNTQRDVERERARANELRSIWEGVLDSQRDTEADRLRILEAAGVERTKLWKMQMELDLKQEAEATRRRVEELRRQIDFVKRFEANEEHKLALVRAYEAQIAAEEGRSAQRRASIAEDFYKKQDERLRGYVDRAVGTLRKAMDRFKDEGWGGFFKAIGEDFRDLLLQMAEDLLKSRLLQLLRNVYKIPAPGATQGAQQEGDQAWNGGGGFDFLDLFKRVFNIGDSSKDADAVSAAGEQMKGAIEQGGDKAADKTEKAGDRQAKTLTSVGQSIVSTMLQVAAAVAAGSQGMGFWKGLLFAAASGAISGAFGKWSQGGGGAGGGGGSQEFSGFANPGQTAASGGLLKGPGTPTSDSILGVDPLTQLATAWVSRDEYVIKASSVAKLGVGALDYINQYGELPAASIGGMLSRMRSRIAASQRQQLAAPGMRALTGGGFEFIPGRAEGGLASGYVPPTSSVGGSSVTTDNSRQVTVNVNQHFDTGGKPVSAQTARQAARRMKGAFAQELE